MLRSALSLLIDFALPLWHVACLQFYLNQFRSLFVSLLQYAVRTAKEQEAAKVESNGAGLAASAVCPTDELFRLWLAEHKFVAHMTAFYSSPTAESSCTRSYILQLCTHLRLSAELLPHSSFVWIFLHSSHQWQSFLPVLRAEELQQARNLHVAPVQPPEEDPASSKRAALERALGMLGGGGGGESAPANPLAFVIPEGYGEGVELGSVFAWHLGYKERPGMDGGAGGAAGGKKKRKKKKNKKKKKSSASASAEADSDEEGDDAGHDSDSSSSSLSSAGPSPNPSPSKKQLNEAAKAEAAANGISKKSADSSDA